MDPKAKMEKEILQILMLPTRPQQVEQVVALAARDLRDPEVEIAALQSVVEALRTEQLARAKARR